MVITVIRDMVILITVTVTDMDTHMDHMVIRGITQTIVTTIGMFLITTTQDLQQVATAEVPEVM